MNALRFSFFAGILIMAYFGAMSIISHNHVDFTGLRFFVELLTIPMFLLMPVILFFAIRYFNRSRLLALGTLVFLAATVSIIIVTA